VVRHGIEQGSSLTKRVAPVLAVVAVLYAVMVPLRIDQYGTLWFAHIGDEFLHSSHTSQAIDSVQRTQSPFGYDGQFYFFIAADPTHARDYMRVGTEDQSGIRYARVVYPAAARLASAGSMAALPAAMIAVNLLAVGLGTAAVALWLVRRGRTPWPAALYGLWPGVVYAVFRDLSEPLAYCFAALAVLVFDPRSNRRLAGAAGLLALSLLTRETTIAFVVGLTVAVGLHDRSWRRPLGFAAVSIAPMIAWRLAVTAWLHVTTIESAHTGLKILLPFYGMYSRYPFDVQHKLIFYSVDLPLLLAGAGALYLLQRRRELGAALLLVLNVALFVVFLPKNVTIDWGAVVRNATPALLAALYLVPAIRSRLVLAAGAFFLSPVWYLLVAAWLGIRGLRFATT
jgi:hypothetical protein